MALGDLEKSSGFRAWFSNGQHSFHVNALLEELRDKRAAWEKTALDQGDTDIDKGRVHMLDELINMLDELRRPDTETETGHPSTQ